MSTPAQSGPSATRLPLTTLLGNYAGTQGIRSGAVTSHLIDLQVADVKVSNRAFPRVVRTREFQVAELALVTFFQARAYGRPLVLMPAVIGAGRTQHQCLVYNAERGPVTLANLAGKRIGIRAHSQTTVAWIRGFLQNDYGVDLDAIKWVTFEGAHVAEFDDPSELERAADGKVLVDMLFAGELDAAIIGSGMPDDARLQPVIPDPYGEAKVWSERTGAIPINHMVAIDSELAASRPDVVREVYRMLRESKRLADDKRPSGPDLTPFGLEASRKSLEVLLDYSWQQRLLPRRLSIDELFDDTTRILGA
jgi:4,5-dihydroxyphthalate decarboxylase